MTYYKSGCSKTNNVDPTGEKTLIGYRIRKRTCIQVKYMSKGIRRKLDAFFYHFVIPRTVPSGNKSAVDGAIEKSGRFYADHVSLKVFPFAV